MPGEEAAVPVLLKLLEDFVAQVEAGGASF